MNKIQNTLKILSNKKVCGTFYRMVLGGGSLAKQVNPGQFVNIRIAKSLKPFLRRPFSIAGAKKNIEILYDVVGEGTALLSKRTSGEMLDVLGPLGNSFSLPPNNTKQIVMIAGGIGIAPFLCLADRLKKHPCEKIVLFGGRTKHHICGINDLKKAGCKVLISTDDGSRGVKGRVSKLFSEIPKNEDTTFIYTCGPEPMMKSVQNFAEKHRIKGEASCEEVMACGVGTCLGCACETKGGYKTACNDGPVFRLDEVILR